MIGIQVVDSRGFTVGSRKLGPLEPASIRCGHKGQILVQILYENRMPVFGSHLFQFGTGFYLFLLGRVELSNLIQDLAAFARLKLIPTAFAKPLLEHGVLGEGFPTGISDQSSATFATMVIACASMVDLSIAFSTMKNMADLRIAVQYVHFFRFRFVQGFVHLFLLGDKAGRPLKTTIA